MRDMKAIHVLNGPNLNLLGTHEPAVYGRETLADIERRIRSLCAEKGVECAFRQTNSEGELVTWVQEAGRAGARVIPNASAFARTSVALHDAIKGSGAVVVEVHISNTRAREPFRHHSYVSPVAKGVIIGLEAQDYQLALQALLDAPAS
jgi:3-dehydroquinate dehydratase-2